MLSAVDAHVGRHLVDHAIMEMLVKRRRTCLLASHQLSVLDRASRVIVLEKGRIAFDGPPAECRRNSTAFAAIRGLNDDAAAGAAAIDATAARATAILVDSAGPTVTAASDAKAFATAGGGSTEHPSDGDDEWSGGDGAAGSGDAAAADGDGVDLGKLTAAEDRETGSVSLTVLTTYARLGGCGVAALALSLLLAKSSAAVGCQAWVAAWTARAPAPRNATDESALGVYEPAAATPSAPASYAPFASAQEQSMWYVGVYALLSLGALVCVLCQQLACVALAIGASSSVHAKAFGAIMRAPLSFFETTPTGRILARFGNDMNVVDTMLMNSLNSSGSQLCVLLVVFVMNACLVPWLAPISFPLFLLYMSLANLYRRSSRELKRLENIAETPVYSGFASCMDGLLTIRAFRGSDERLIASTDATINDWVACWLKNNIANRWMGVRLDLIGAGLSGSVGLFGLLWADGVIGDAAATFNAGLIGLMLSFTASQASMLNWMVRGVAEAEQHATSLERCLTMANVRPERWGDDEISTGGAESASTRRLTSPGSPPSAVAPAGGDAVVNAGGAGGGAEAASEWPTQGTIQFQSLSMRYRAGLPVCSTVSRSASAAGSAWESAVARAPGSHRSPSACFVWSSLMVAISSLMARWPAHCRSRRYAAGWQWCSRTPRSSREHFGTISTPPRHMTTMRCGTRSAGPHSETSRSTTRSTRAVPTCQPVSASLCAWLVCSSSALRFSSWTRRPPLSIGAPTRQCRPLFAPSMASRSSPSRIAWRRSWNMTRSSSSTAAKWPRSARLRNSPPGQTACSPRC